MEPKKVAGFGETLRKTVEYFAKSIVKKAAENARLSVARSLREFEYSFEGGDKSTSEDSNAAKTVTALERQQAIFESIKRDPDKFVINAYEDDKVPERAYKVLLEEIERIVEDIV